MQKLLGRLLSTHLFSFNLLNNYYIPGPMLEAGNPGMRKAIVHYMYCTHSMNHAHAKSKVSVSFILAKRRA